MVSRLEAFVGRASSWTAVLVAPDPSNFSG